MLIKTFLRCAQLFQNIEKTVIGIFPFQNLVKWINQKWRKEGVYWHKSTGRYEIPCSVKNAEPFTTLVDLDFRQIQSGLRRSLGGADRIEKRPLACHLILVGEEQKEGSAELPQQSIDEVNKTAVPP